MAEDRASEPAAPGTGARPAADDDTTRDSEVGSAVDGTPAEDVAATGTALHRGERDSGLDLEGAPGAAGPGAG